MLFAVGAVNPKLTRGNRPVQRQRRSGHGARSQRTEVQPRGAILQPVRIAQRHLHIRQQPMRNKHRLGPLQMRVARHHGLAGLARLFHQRLRPRCKPVHGESDLFAHEEPQVRRDLFVAAAPGVKLEPQRTHALHQLEFDEVMNVFGRSMIANERFARARFVFRRNRVQRRSQLRSFAFS